jgi:hypothetical protein
LLDSHLLLHLAILNLHQEAIAGHPGVIDDAVDAAKVAPNVSEKRDDGLLVRHISRIVCGLGSSLGAKLDRLFQFHVIDVHQCDVGPLARQGFRHLLAEASGRAGDHDCPAFQIHFRLQGWLAFNRKRAERRRPPGCAAFGPNFRCLRRQRRLTRAHPAWPLLQAAWSSRR